MADALAGLMSDEAIEDLLSTAREAGTLLKGARPWLEFFEVFKPPVKTDVERRMSTNFLHYRANYAQIWLGVVCVAAVTSPRLLLALALGALLSLLVMVAKVQSFDIGDTTIHLTKRTRVLSSTFLTAFLVVLFGGLLWLLLFALLGLFLCLSHMALRPRTLAAKYNAATEDVKAMFFGGRTAAAEADSVEGGTYYDADFSGGGKANNLHSRRHGAGSHHLS